MPKYKISDIILEMDVPEQFIHNNFKFFNVTTGASDISCSVIFERRSAAQIIDSRPMVRTRGSTLYEIDGYYHQWNGDDADIPSYMIVSSDWSSCTFYIDPDYNIPDEVVQTSVREGILSALRSIVIGKLAGNQGLIIHSCSIIRNGRGILFSAPSGTGKSTHANLWRKMYGTPVLDGDTTACRLIDGVPIVYGLPWCGTSGEFMNRCVPLGAMVFLQQAKENNIRKLDFHEAFLRLTSRSFILPWDNAMTNKFLDTAQNIAQNADCYLLNCRPDHEAVEVVKNCLERA